MKQRIRYAHECLNEVPVNIKDDVVVFVTFFSSHRFPGGKNQVVPVQQGKVQIPQSFQPTYYCMLDRNYRGLKCQHFKERL